MTRDIIDEFSDALDRERRGYVILVRHGAAVGAGAHVRWDFKHWPAPLNGVSKSVDAVRGIACALDADGPIAVLDEAQRNTVLGALDSLGAALAASGHEWTEGERAIYEQAVAALGAKLQPPEEST